MLGTDDFRLEISDYSNVCVKGVVSDTLTTFGIFLASEAGNSIWNRSVIAGDICFAAPNADCDAIYAANMRCGMLMIKPDILNDLLHERGVDLDLTTRATSRPACISSRHTQSLLRAFTSLEATLANNSRNTIEPGPFEFVFLHLFDVFVETINHAEILDRHFREIDSTYYKIVKDSERIVKLTPKISLEEISSTLDISRRTLYRAFKSTLGVSPNSYLHNYRLGKSRTNLKMNVSKPDPKATPTDDNQPTP